ncbi:Transcription elongation factor spt6 [Entamoeba marina]
MGNIRISLDFIVDELLNPFKDKRPKFNPMHDYEIFKCVTNESPDDFKIGQPIDFVLKPSTKGRGQITNCLEVVINSYDTPNNSFDTRNDQVRPMNGRIDKVDLERCVIVVNCNEKWQTPDINRLYDELINKERCLQVLEKERRMESKEQNQSNNYMNVKDKYFKIASYSQAVAEISRNYVGSWMIIPIEEGGLFSNKLKIIWKWSSSVISNINVKEIEKRRDRIGKIQIGDNIYDDLEDCRKRYIEVVNQYLNEVRQHRKYHNDDSLVDNEILRKKFENPSVFQYRFSFSKEKSGNIRLSFIPGSKTIVNEFISVSEKGFTRNGNTYTDLDSLADAFKQEIMKLSQQ